jgi:LPXTG-site transpeptidase (sortase) family protein
MGGRRRSRRRLLAVALILLGLIVATAGLYLWLHRNPTKTPPPAVNILGPAPFPTAPAASLGMRVKVPQLGIDLPVVEGDGWTVPLNAAAHYPGMKQPGEGDRSLLYAHAQTGMFGPLLTRGATGQRVEVDRPGKPALNYVIVEYKRVSAGDDQWLKGVGHEEVVLLTCTTYNPNDPRVIAVAEPQ